MLFRSLNVNFPSPANGPFRGMKVCRQAMARWQEDFEERLDPHRRAYFWMRGKFVNDDHDEKTDESALRDSYVSVVPVKYDFTAHNLIDDLNNALEAERKRQE